MEVFWYHIIIPDLRNLFQLTKKFRTLLQSVTKNHLVHLQNLKNQPNLQILRQELLQGKNKLTYHGFASISLRLLNVLGSNAWRSMADWRPTLLEEELYHGQLTLSHWLKIKGQMIKSSSQLGVIRPPQDIWQYLESFWGVTTDKGAVIEEVKAWDAAKHPIMPRSAPPNRNPSGPKYQYC